MCECTPHFCKCGRTNKPKANAADRGLSGTAKEILDVIIDGGGIVLDFGLNRRDNGISTLGESASKISVEFAVQVPQPPNLFLGMKVPAE